MDPLLAQQDIDKVKRLIEFYNKVLRKSTTLRTVAMKNQAVVYDNPTHTLIKGCAQIITTLRLHEADLERYLGKWQLFTFKVAVDGEMRTYAATKQEEMKEDDQDKDSSTKTPL